MDRPPLISANPVSPEVDGLFEGNLKSVGIKSVGIVGLLEIASSLIGYSAIRKAPSPDSEVLWEFLRGLER